MEDNQNNNNSTGSNNNQGEKMFSQEEVNEIIAKRLKSKENDISKAEFNLLKKENEQLRMETKIPTIKEHYKKYGGVDGKPFEDFLKLNNDLFEINDLNKAMEVKSKEFNWAFSSSKPSDNVTKYDSVIGELVTPRGSENLVEGTIYPKNGKADFYSSIKKQINK